MARVTMELRKVLEIEEFNLFDFEYEISDLSWKEDLERDFVDTFYFNEIGMETIDRWKHYVKRKFQHIMPYYNKLYMSTLMELDPLLTHKRTETYTGENTGSGTGTTSDNNKTFDYPQNANPAQDIASSMDDSSSRSSTSSTSAMNSPSASFQKTRCWPSSKRRAKAERKGGDEVLTNESFGAPI